MSMTVVFEVTRKTGKVKAGTRVTQLMRFCKKSGAMQANLEDGREVTLPRSRLRFVEYVRPTAGV